MSFEVAVVVVCYRVDNETSAASGDQARSGECARESTRVKASALAARWTIFQQLPDRDLAQATLRLVRERAPDEQLALAFLSELLEQSPAETTEMLREPQGASDLVFCLGASELVGTGLAKLGRRWGSVFRMLAPALLRNCLALSTSLSQRRKTIPQITQRLAEFKNSIFSRNRDCGPARAVNGGRYCTRDVAAGR